MDPQVPQPEYFEHAYTTKNKMVRIWKVKDVDATSKAHPFGSYPPPIQTIVDQGKAFTGGH